MNLYLTLKALHLIAAISWMAGLLYLPRIFVYHTETVKDDQQNLTFKTMERKLYNYIMMPAMIFTWLFGILLIHSLGFSVFLERVPSGKIPRAQFDSRTSAAEASAKSPPSSL